MIGRVSIQRIRGGLIKVKAIRMKVSRFSSVDTASKGSNNNDYDSHKATSSNQSSTSTIDDQNRKSTSDSYLSLFGTKIFSLFMKRLSTRSTSKREGEEEAKGILFPYEFDHLVPEKALYEQCFQMIQNHSNTLANKNSTFNTYIDKSSIPGDSGNGLFAKSFIPKGTLISFYPGAYYPPLPLWTVGLPDGLIATDLRPTGRGRFEDAYRIYHSNGGYFDGLKGVSSPIALAHLINHPPRIFSPNVVSIDFLWKSLCKSTGLSLNHPTIHTLNQLAVGTDWFLDPITEEIVKIKESPNYPLAGIVFVSSKDIQPGQELFYDYRYDVKVYKPDWYEPVEEKK
jgi:hypothetical protein